jgi:hypothetical protein
VHSALPRARRPPVRWIVSPAYDLGFFVLSASATFALWGLYELLVAAGHAPDGSAVLITYLAFSGLLDLPHVFQTFSRTHRDPAEFARRRRLYTVGLPLLVAAGCALHAGGFERELVTVLALYGSWHVIRQHVGLARLYAMLNERPSAFDRALDEAMLVVGMGACVLRNYTDARAFGIEPVPVYGSLTAPFPMVPIAVADAVMVVAGLLLLVFVFRQAQRVRRGEPLNLPKLLLVGTALATHLGIFVFAAVPFLVAEALETAYHDVQYLGWMAHYQRRRFPAASRAAAKWLGAGLLYGALAGTLEGVGLADRAWAWLFAPFAMLTLFHYYIDGKIWRTREAPELRELLGVPRDAHRSGAA